MITEDFPKSNIKSNSTNAKADETCVDLTCDSEDDDEPKKPSSKLQPPKMKSNGM
jgi:hypothetical protein